MKLTIGHPAYHGANAFEHARNKTHAVSILQARGMVRRVAREHVAKAIDAYKRNGYSGYVVASLPAMNVCEINATD